MNREELIKVLKDWKPELELMAKYNDNSIDYQRYRALDETTKALEQEPILDKIRAEIKEAQTYKMFEGEDTVYVERNDVLAIIDKCKAEKE